MFIQNNARNHDLYNSSKLLVEECIEKLRKEKKVPFTRQQLIDCVKEKHPEWENISLANYLIEISRDITASSQYGAIDMDVIKWKVSIIVDILKNSPYWNERRWAAYSVGSIGQVNIVLVKDAIPVLIDYIQYPDKPISEILAIAKHDKHVAADIYASECLGDPKEMLREACIGVIGAFAQCHPESVKEAIKEERLNLSYALIPKVSNEEMKEIEEKIGKPADFDKDEFDDITDRFSK